MRVWDLSPSLLCNRHLLAEHRELHAIWTILTEGRRGYARHPETLRWRGKMKALHGRHEQLVSEFRRRRFDHRSPLDASKAAGLARQNTYVDSIPEQRRILHAKGCGCRV